MTNNLKLCFDQMRNNQGKMRRLPLDGAPLDCWYGSNNDRIFIAFRTFETHLVFEDSEAIEVHIRTINPRGERFIYLIVTDRKYEEQFIKICEDLIWVTRNAPTPSMAVQRLCTRYNEWKMFWKRRREGLTSEQVQGLVGELLYLEALIKRGQDPIELIEAWHGVNGSDQDFVFKNRWAEVKTIKQAGSEVKISSLEQLENPWNLEGVDGRLVVVRVHNDPVGGDSFNLILLVKRIQKLLETHSLAQRLLLDSLDRVGANIENGCYESKLNFSCLEIMEFQASDKDFPKLVRTNRAIPTPVLKVTYSLSLPGLRQWLIVE